MDFTTLAFEHPQAIDRCGYYGRVSTPRQKLEHQREHVLRWCEGSGIVIPDRLRFEDKEKRHKSAKREAFQRLLDICRRGELDWIVICSFDRWGVADVDEFFEFRRTLLKHDVQLWSVVDNMNLTSLNEGDYFRIVAMAVGATKYVEQMAEKNVLKMVEMAKKGWAATGNAPFGLDLVCYPLHDTAKPLFRVVRMRYKNPHLYRILWADGREEVSQRMPIRDKKATGYRFEPTIERERLKAVNLMYELYDGGMTFAAISEHLWRQGYKHYDKPFGYHGVETILLNPAYIGLPAWGKFGVGAYRIAHDEKPVRIKRRSTDTLVIRKREEQYIQPSKPLFDPVVPTELWQRVHAKLLDRPRTNPAFGKRRTKDKAKHPLNGKLFCPDCDTPMVLGSFSPRQGKRHHCFHCGTWRKTIRTQCNSNTVRWNILNEATGAFLKTVEGRIDRLTDDRVLDTLQKEEWARSTELGKLLLEITTPPELAGDPGVLDAMGRMWQLWTEGRASRTTEGALGEILEVAIQRYRDRFDAQVGGLRCELESIDSELARIAQTLIEGVPSQTVRGKLNARMTELEARKSEIGPSMVPLTDTAMAVTEQLLAIRQAIHDADKGALASLLDTYVEKVVPVLEVQEVGRSKRRRTKVIGFRFLPKDAYKKLMPGVMEFCATRTGRGSSPRRG